PSAAAEAGRRRRAAAAAAGLHLADDFRRAGAALCAGDRARPACAARLHRGGARHPPAPGPGNACHRRGRAMKALRALLPAPGLSALVLVLWLVLARPPSAAQLLLGLALALAVPRLLTLLR